MTKHELAFYKALKSKDITSNVNVEKYKSVNGKTYYKVITVDRLPIKLITGNEKKLLEYKGYIQDATLMTVFFYEYCEAAIEKKNKKLKKHII